jgi:predicted phosphodiesterase
MNLFSHLNIQKYIAIGDIHGEFKRLFHIIKNNVVDKCNLPTEKVLDEETFKFLQPHLENLDYHDKDSLSDVGYKTRNIPQLNDSVIIIAGDCGFGFEKEEYYYQIFNKFHQLLIKNNIYIYFVRGNHDDPSYFIERKINYEHIKSVPDYSIIQTAQNNILCVGGAISVDRIWRKQEECRLNKYKKIHLKRRYWEDEKPFFSQELVDEIMANNIKITDVITHTSPQHAFPDVKPSLSHWAKRDKQLNDDVIQERTALTNLFNYLTQKGNNIKSWVYGHFHMSYSEIIDKVLYIALDDTFQFKNINACTESQSCEIGMFGGRIPYFDMSTNIVMSNENEPIV